MIKNYLDFKSVFAEMVIRWWGCSEHGDMEKDTILFLFLKALSHKNQDLSNTIDDKTGVGWDKKSEEYLIEIQIYGLGLYRELKTIIQTNANIEYNEVKELVDRFLAVYTVEGMINYRWSGFYMGDEIVNKQEVRKLLSNSSNRIFLLDNWNRFTRERRAKILKFGDDKTFDFIKKNIDNLYDLDSQYLFKAKLWTNLNDLVFGKKYEFIDIYLETLIEINNLCYFDKAEDKRKIKILMEIEFPVRNDWKNEIDDFSTILEKPKFDFLFITSKQPYGNYYQNKENIKMLLIRDEKGEKKGHEFWEKYVLNKDKLSNGELEFLGSCEKLESEINQVFNRDIRNRNDELRIENPKSFINTCKKYYENIIGYNLLAILINKNGVEYFDSNKSPFLIRHKYKIEFKNEDRKVKNILHEVGNWNVKYAKFKKMNN